MQTKSTTFTVSDNANGFTYTVTTREAAKALVHKLIDEARAAGDTRPGYMIAEVD